MSIKKIETDRYFFFFSLSVTRSLVSPSNLKETDRCAFLRTPGSICRSLTRSGGNRYGLIRLISDFALLKPKSGNVLNSTQSVPANQLVGFSAFEGTEWTTPSLPQCRSNTRRCQNQ